MQYNSCVCILWHAEPQNWFNPGPGVGGGLYSIISGYKVPFWDSYNYFIFWHFVLTFLFKNANLRIKKKGGESQPSSSDNLGRSEKGKQISFLGLILCASICWYSTVYAGTGTVMTSFFNAIISARGNWFQSNQPDHESDDHALLLCVLPMRKIWHSVAKFDQHLSMYCSSRKSKLQTGPDIGSCEKNLVRCNFQNLLTILV